jgi:hypothetical protein
MLNPRIAVTINGNPYTLAFDFGAALTLQKEFKISWQDLDRFRKPGAKEAEDLELLAKLVYAMTRSSEPAPSMTEIQRMSLVELAACAMRSCVAWSRRSTAIWGKTGRPAQSQAPRPAREVELARSAHAGARSPRHHAGAILAANLRGVRSHDRSGGATRGAANALAGDDDGEPHELLAQAPGDWK